MVADRPSQFEIFKGCLSINQLSVIFLNRNLSYFRSDFSTLAITVLLVPPARQAVQQYIDEWSGVEFIGQGRSSVEPEAGITIILMSEKSLPPEFKEGPHRSRT